MYGLDLSECLVCDVGCKRCWLYSDNFHQRADVTVDWFDHSCFMSGYRLQFWSQNSLNMGKEYIVYVTFIFHEKTDCTVFPWGNFYMAW
jgi:hypothetical protein